MNRAHSWRARLRRAGRLPGVKGTWTAYKHWRLASVLRVFVSRFGPTVRNGPFRGLRYLPESAGSALMPKLLGTYESALHAVVAEIAQNRYDTIVDIGCAEGYYAVGLAQRFSSTPVVAFDANPRALELCHKLAEINGVLPRLKLRGKCTPDGLSEALRGRSLVVCDCEGDEGSLLDPALVKGLGASDVIVELHPFVDSGIPDLIEERFRDTHETRLVRGSDGALRPDELKLFRRFDRALATSEGRSGAEAVWMVLNSRMYSSQRVAVGSASQQPLSGLAPRERASAVAEAQ